MAEAKQKVLVRARTPARVQAPSPAVRQMLLQTALQVGAVNDPAEHEAENMASRVVASSAPDASGAPPDPPKNPPIALSRSAEDQPNLDELSEGTVPAEHADVEVAKPEDVDTEKLEGGDTAELESGEPEDTSGQETAPNLPPVEDAPLPVALAMSAEAGAVVGRSGGAAPGDVANLVAHPGPGRPLPRSVRQRVEPHFGQSFEYVRLHDSAADRRAAARIGARAFTHKNRIWLGAGESETNTRLMAHELTHVVQQTRGSDTLPLSREAVVREPATPVIRRGYFARKAESVARHIPGYTLITVLVGRKLISGERVPMTGENLLGGLMGLVPGGTVIFDRLKEARVIEEAFQWVRDKLDELNLTWDRIKSDLSEALDTYNPFKAARNVKRMIVNLVRDIIRFVGAVTKKILEFIIRGALKLAGPFGEKVWGVLQRAGEVIGLIIEDPLGFAKNLVKAVIGGFKQFVSNIWEHLKKGFLGWLFGSLASAGIEMPAKLDFKGIMSIVLQILGLTYANFRKQLVKKLGPKGEKMVGMMETSVEVVKILLKEGFVGIWQKLLGMIEGFRNTVIGGISEFIITSLVKAGVGWLAGLSNPVGAIVKIVLSIYNLIVAFIERIDQIIDVCESIFSSVGAIARGQVASAANFIEETIGRTVPLIISFLAALIPVSGITNKIRSLIKQLQAPVQTAMGNLIGFLVKKAKKLFSKLIGKVNGKRKLPSVNFRIGAKQHRILAVKDKKKIDVHIASEDGKDIDEIEKEHKVQAKLIDAMEGEGADQAKSLAKKLSAETEEADDDTAKVAKVVRPEAKDENQRKRIDALMKELEATAKELEEAGQKIDNLGQISSQTEKGLFRAGEPRLENFEGRHDEHKNLLKEAQQPMNAKMDYKRTSFYEMDHTIEKRFVKTLLENLPLIDLEQSEKRAGEDAVAGAENRADRAARYKESKDAGRDAGKKTAVSLEDAAPLGLIGGEIKKIPEDAPSFPAIAVYRHNHIKDKGLKNAVGMIEAARKTKDPHAHVKSTLKAQMDLEEQETLAKLDADTSATETIRANMKAGLAAARARNDAIFGLADVGARKVGEDEKKSREYEAISSNLSFTGGNGAPNFLQVEGVGGAYGSLTNMTEHLERDHIIDKAYPKMVAGLSLMKPGEKGGFEDKVRTRLKAGNQRMSPGRKARLDEVLGANLYPAGSAMAGYTDGSGYAIPIYKPVAREVTSLTGTAIGPQDLAAKAGGSIEANLIAYVIDGAPDKLQAARDARTAGVEAELRSRTDAHVGHVKSAYEKNKSFVPSGQEPGVDAAARAYMDKIVAQVANSLARSRIETERLF